MRQRRMKTRAPTAGRTEYSPAYGLVSKAVPEEIPDVVHRNTTRVERAQEVQEPAQRFREPLLRSDHEQRGGQGRPTTTESGYQIPLTRPADYIDITDEDTVYDYVDETHVSAMFPSKDA